MPSTTPQAATVEDEPTEAIAKLPEYIEPSFDIRMLRRKLLDPNTTDKDKAKLLLGLHYKMWHLPPSEMRRLLHKGGYSKDLVQLGFDMAKSCKICQPWVAKLTKPVAAGGTIATYFGERLQTDLFELWS